MPAPLMVYVCMYVCMYVPIYLFIYIKYMHTSYRNITTYIDMRTPVERLHLQEILSPIYHRRSHP